MEQPLYVMGSHILYRHGLQCLLTTYLIKIASHQVVGFHHASDGNGSNLVKIDKFLEKYNQPCRERMFTLKNNGFLR